MSQHSKLAKKKDSSSRLKNQAWRPLMTRKAAKSPKISLVELGSSSAGMGSYSKQTHIKHMTTGVHWVPFLTES